MIQDTIAALEARIADLRKELSRHPLSRELAILTEAVDKLRELPGGNKTFATIDAPSLPLSVPQRPNASSRGTILETAEALVRRSSEPLSTRALLAALAEHGVIVGGKNPASNLSSILSKRSKQLRSIGQKRSARWCPIDRPLANEELLEEAAE